MRTKFGTPTLRSALVLALLGASAAMSAACSPKRCDYDARTPDKAVASIQCPSGDVCYQGDCRRACEPGREQATPCTDDSECKDPGLPHCVGSSVLNASFCSSCESNDVCIPQLGICQPVVEIILPEPPTPTRQPPPPQPLDGGAIDGSVFAEPDAGGTPTLRDLTHVGSMLLARGVAGGSGAPMGFEQLEVAFYDVRAATSTRGIEAIAASGQCEVILPPTYFGRAVPADLGTVRIQSFEETPRALPAPINLAFDAMLGRYAPATAVGTPLFNFSTPPRQDQFVSVSSPGATGLTSAWPSITNFHLPYELEPDAATRALMAGPVTLADPPEDLTVRWAQASPMRGAFAGEFIALRVSGGLYELRCREPEGIPNTLDHITVPAALFSAYALADGVMRGETRQLVVQRIMEQVLDVSPAAPDVAAEVTLTITHAFVTELTF